MSRATELREKIGKLKGKKAMAWICHLCNQKYPSAPYCVEHHFEEKHPRVNRDNLVDSKHWDNLRLTDEEVEKYYLMKAELKGILSAIAKRKEKEREFVKKTLWWIRATDINKIEKPALIKNVKELAKKLLEGE